MGGFGTSGATFEDGIIARAELIALGADTGALDECSESSCTFFRAKPPAKPVRIEKVMM